jgi:hypothetical protein
MFLSVDGGRSWISVGTRQGAHHRCFLALMVDAPESPASALPKGPAVDVFTLMVGAPGSRAPGISQGSTLNVFYIDGVHSRSPLAPARGPTIDVS